MDLPDLTGRPLADLLADDDSVLAVALRRLVAELDDGQEVIAAFDSYAGSRPEEVANGLVPEPCAQQLP